MFNSIRWRFIFVYFMLVFVAMIIVGVFIINAIEIQQNDQVRNEMMMQAQKLELSIGFEDQEPAGQAEKINSLFASWPVSIEDRIYLLSFEDNPQIIASAPKISEVLLDSRAFGHDELDAPLIVEGIQQGKQLFKSIETRDAMSLNMHLVYPIRDALGNPKGLIYIMSSLKKNYELLNAAKRLFLQATLMALVITVILGYLVARSITKPINAVTQKAEKMAQGDFDQYVDIESSDEIGQLGRMFNYLTQALKGSMAEINQEKSKLEAILYYMADGLLAVNKEGRIIHANLVAQELFQLEQKKMDYYTYEDVVESKLSKLSLAEILEEGNNVGSQVINYGTKIYKVQYAPFYTDEREISGVIFLFQDMTEEEKLERLRRDFVANVSHELKTPLTTIKSYTETILDGVEDPKLSESFLKTINSECDRMNRIVRELLELSSMDHKQKKWRFEAGKIQDLVGGCIRKMQLSAKEKNQTLSFERKEIPALLFDYDGLEQVVLNIISNAIKYTPEQGHVHVCIREEAHHVIVLVQDDGIGISKEDMPRLFERFYRVDKARSRALGGTGLGLSIAKEIMEAHGGTVEVKSELGRGTEVWLRLPKA